MDKIANSISKKLNKLQKRFESVLENEFDTNHDEIEKQHLSFEATRDLALIRGISIGLPEDHVDKAIVLFSRLSLFFDSGVLVENSDGQWQSQAIFDRGHTHLLKEGQQKQLSLPAIGPLTVLKTSSQSLLSKLNLERLDAKQNTVCLLIKPTPDFAYLLFSSLPDLWLKEHSENILHAVADSFVS